MEFVRVGVAGVGHMGSYHLAALSELQEANLVAIADKDKDRGEELAGKYGAEYFANPDNLIGKVDAVVVALPTVLHYTTAKKFLESGIHVLVEKPIASTTAEAESMIALAEEQDVILQVGHIERFNPAFTYLEKIAEHPRFIEAHRLAAYPPSLNGQRPRGTEVSV